MSAIQVESLVGFLNVDVDVSGPFDRHALVRGLGESVVVMRNETDARGESHVAFELGSDATLGRTVERLIALVAALPEPARLAWRTATRRAFDIGIQAGLEPHRTTWRLGADLVAALAAIEVEIIVTVYGAAVETAQAAAVSFPSAWRPDATMFDAYVFCDWSASSTPKTGRDSLWLCRGRYSESGALGWEIENPATRREGRRTIRRWLVESVSANERTLAGFDFSFGLPESTYGRLGFVGWHTYWEYLHARLTEGDRNENNRFVVASELNRRADVATGGPFWGAPPAATGPHLGATKPRADPAFPEFRAVETTLRARKLRPLSTWQLYGNGSVGSQALVGIPVLQALRIDPELAAHTRVWPFEQSEARKASVVLAECWPGMIDVDLAAHPVRDAAQMIALTAWAAREDLAGRLASHLAAPGREPRARTEGWVLGEP